MSELLIGHAVGSVCYGLSTLFAIKLRGNLYVPIAAALAPAVASQALSVHRGYLALAPVFVSVIALALARRSVREIAAHSFLFAATMLVASLGKTAGGGSGVVLAVSVAATALYALGEGGRGLLEGMGGRIKGQPFGAVSDMRMWWLLVSVVVCASGLTVLVVDRLGWPVLLAMTGVLALTKREFEAFARSRVAYEQTVLALDALERRGVDLR